MNSSSPSGDRATYLVPVLGVSDVVPVSGDREQRIAAIANRQRGRVRRDQLRAAGLSDATIDRLVAKCYLLREHRSVYVVGFRANVPLGAETSALLAAGEGAVLSHLTAANLFKLLSYQGPVHVTTANRQLARSNGLIAHRSASLQSADVQTFERLPITSRARTLLDIAELISERQLERALDEALRSRNTHKQITELLERTKGRRRMSVLAALVHERAGSTRSRSENEERFLALIRKAGLPHPEMNVPLHGFTVDFLWREQRVVFEVDGYDYHRGRFEFNRDRRKDAVLKANQFDPNRISGDQVEYEPLAVVAQLARTLARAEARRGPSEAPRET